MEQKKKRPDAEAAVHAYTTPEMKKTDPLGSYTGQPDDPHEKPVQDADDL